MQLRIWLAIGLAALGWGTSGPATRAALATGVPPLTLAGIRTIIAGIVITAIIYGSRRRYPRERTDWRLGAVMGTVNLAVPFVATTIALQFASSGFVGLLIALIPMATAALAHYLLPNEPLYRGKVAGLAIALAGVGFLLMSGDSGLSVGGRPLLAAVLTVGAVLSISYGAIYAKRREASFDPVVLTGMQLLVGAALIAPAMVFGDGLTESPTAWGWTLVVYLAVAGSVIPFLLYYWVLQRTTTTTASLTAYVVPLIGLITGIAFLDERLDAGIAVGGALILAGLVVLNRFERMRTRDPSQATRA